MKRALTFTMIIAVLWVRSCLVIASASVVAFLASAYAFAGDTEEPPPKDDEMTEFQVVDIHEKQKLLVRAEPGRLDTLVGRIDGSGIKVHVRECEEYGNGKRRWCRINYGVIDGWVERRYLKKLD